MISALEKLSWPKRYGAGVALATVALTLQWLLSHWVQQGVPFLLFIPTAALCAALLGQVQAMTVFLVGLLYGGMMLAESLPGRISLLAYAAVSLFFMLVGDRVSEPDIVLLDIGMPCLSGIEVARQIRATAAGRNVTLVAVTGWGQSADRSSTMAAGFDYHLTKPVDPAGFRTLLAGSQLKTGSA